MNGVSYYQSDLKMKQSRQNEQHQFKHEFFGGLFVILILGFIVYMAQYEYHHDNDVMATSKYIMVTVTGKRIGAGKGHPRLVYIRDGVVPVGVKTRGKWYFETVVGEQTVVKYSPKYHEYREPYHRPEPLGYLVTFISIVTLIMIGRMVWLAQQVWFDKKENPDLSAQIRI